MGKNNLLFDQNIDALGSKLRAERKRLGLTLHQCSVNTKINVGQLSRFEKGEFKRNSKNLQIYTSYLQIIVNESNSDLIERFRLFSEKSSAHRNACRLLLEVLEQLS
jgi:transcriptional regulator with XRE-family HTH domain